MPPLKAGLARLSAFWFKGDGSGAVRQKPMPPLKAGLARLSVFWFRGGDF
jgi:hypothetical protein